MLARMTYEHSHRSLSITLSVASFILCHSTLASTTHFCGTAWEDASTDCANKQPCPLGTDEECHSGTCWADTKCDTTNGGGLAFDKGNPQHSRFCGIGWAEAKDNCSPATHCPSGSNDECEDGEQCYSWLPDCNFADMITGGEQQGSSQPKFDPDDPVRSFFCGSSFADADGSCFKEDHWCPSGSDKDCPAGKICFSSTSCKFDSDLDPSRAPILSPSAAPTQSPVVYNSIENTRFCGVGWDDASNTCRIGTHCGSGENSDCPEGQSCYGWVSGCNIIDLKAHLLTTGTEIFGKDKLPLPEGGVETLIIDLDNIIPEHHMFCGYNFAHASTNCSLATFCSDGINHKCPDGEKCWSGVTECDASEWLSDQSTSPTKLSPTQQPVIIDLIATTAEPVSAETNQPTSFSVITTTDDAEIVLITSPPTTSSLGASSTIATFSPSLTTLPPSLITMPSSKSPTQNQETLTLPPTKHSLTEDEITDRLTNYNNYCAKSQDEVLSSCSYTLQTCNDLMMMCPVGTFCFYNILCPDPNPSAILTSSENQPNATTSELRTTSPTPQPSFFPVTNSPTQQLQNYCAGSSLELLSKCNTAPRCNEGDDPCPVNTMCFKDIICDVIQDETMQGNQPTSAPTYVTSDHVTFHPTLSQVHLNSMLPENPFECTGLCLMPIDSSDCGYILSLGLNIPPCNRIEVQNGDACLATGRCETDLELNNCVNDQDIYIRVESSMCIDAGLLDGNGVISPSSSETQTAPSLSPSSLSIEGNDVTSPTLSELLSNPSLPPVPRPTLSVSVHQITDSDSNIDTTDKSENWTNTMEQTDMISNFTDQNIDNEKFKESDFIDWFRASASSCTCSNTQATLLSIGHFMFAIINALI